MVDLYINPELLAIVPEPTKEDFESLKKSIEEHGQRQRIVVWSDSITSKSYIIDGHSRNEVCIQLKIKPVIEYKEFDSWDYAILYAIQVNSKRRHLSDMQKVEITLKEIQIEKKISSERQKLTLPKNEQKGFQKLPSGMHTGNTCDLVAAKTGLSSRTVARHKKILDEGSDELKQKVASGKKSAAAAERQINLEKIHTNPIPLPDGQFKVILCDVPFKYDFEGTGAPNYPTLAEDEIISLKDTQGKPISGVFAPNTIIFFWTPMPKLDEALRILQSWGFSYKTSIVWSKEKEGVSQQGTGFYVVATCELVLIATKGTPGVPLPQNRLLGILKAPRTNHSKKPDMLRHWIEKMYPNEKYLELFARETAKGWTAWGNQLDIKDVVDISKTTTRGTLDEFDN